MSKVVTTTVLPDVAGGSVTLGGTGDSVVVTGNDLRTNVLQDAGGNAVFTSDGSGVLSGMNSGLSSGALNLIQSQTVSNQASVSFTTGIDSTYDVYIFKFIDINPATDNTYFGFQANASGQSGYNETITSSNFAAYGYESGGTPRMEYRTGSDQGQGTGFQLIGDSMGGGSDESLVGEMFLFSPSNTTYVTHFYATTQEYFEANASLQSFTGGYINVTAAITNIQFKMSSGNLDGTIKLYGISKS